MTNTPVLLTPSGAAYIRGSTIEQQNTLGVQRIQLQHYSALKGVPIGAYFVDEGESATQVSFFDRPMVQEMLAWMRQTGATEIVITKLDRGFRDAIDVLQTISRLEQQGIHLHLLDIGLDPTTAIGKLIVTVMAAVAAFECARKSERQTETTAKMRAEKQRTGAIPYGWDTLPTLRMSKTGRRAENLIVNPVEMQVLRQILAWSEAGESDQAIQRKLNAAGVPTKNAGKPMTRQGRSWVCDGIWSAAQVLSVRRHALLPETQPTAQAA